MNTINLDQEIQIQGRRIYLLFSMISSEGIFKREKDGLIYLFLSSVDTPTSLVHIMSPAFLSDEEYEERFVAYLKKFEDEFKLHGMIMIEIVFNPSNEHKTSSFLGIQLKPRQLAIFDGDQRTWFLDALIDENDCLSFLGRTGNISVPLSNSEEQLEYFKSIELLMRKLVGQACLQQADKLDNGFDQFETFIQDAGLNDLFLDDSWQKLKDIINILKDSPRGISSAISHIYRNLFIGDLSILDEKQNEEQD